MTDKAIDECRAAIREQRDEIRKALETEGVDVGSWSSSETTDVDNGETTDSD